MGALVPGLEPTLAPGAAAAAARPATTEIGWRDRFGALRMRLGIGRHRYAIEPGLYRIGDPSSASPVLVTANYKLTFDALRSKLAGVDAWILVLDTKGINVWCAAGKNTFSTEELCRRILESDLYNVVEHRTVILPQLGAPGVAAHDVRAFTDFRVVYGPIRAEDIPAFLDSGMKASEEMRGVTFTLYERFVLTGVELSLAWRPRVLVVLAAIVMTAGIGAWGYSADAFVARGAVVVLAALSGLLAGAFVTPLLLPWVPSRLFAAKGAIVGTVVGTGLVAAATPAVGPLAAVGATSALIAIASYAAMNFTGTTPYTSPSGVEYEMRRWLPVQVVLAVLAAVLWIASAFLGKGW